MKLPREVKKFFWDIDTSKATPAKHTRYYISRVLEKGNGKAVDWLFKTFGKRTVKKLVPGSRLSPRSANYWFKFFGLA